MTAERVIRTGSAVYVDENGLHQRGDCGDTVRVHDSDLVRFDALNVLLSWPNPVPIPAEDEGQVHAAEDEPAPDAAKKTTRSRAKPEE